MKRLAMAACVLLAGCAHARLLAPAELSVVEYEIPWEGAFPNDIAVDDEGRVWFTDRMRSLIGRFDPETSTFDSLVTPRPGAAPYGFIASADGKLWYAGARAGSLGEVDPATGVIVEHRIPGAEGGPHLLAVSGETIWFSLRAGRAYGRYDVRTGESRIFEAPERTEPYAVVVTPDGTVWINGYESYELLRVDPVTGAATHVDLREPAPDSVLRRFAGRPDSAVMALRSRDYGEVRRLAVDAEGGLWFTDFRRGRVTRYDPATGAREHFPSLDRLSRPYGIRVDGHGRVWYAERGTSKLAMLDPKSGERVRLPLTEGGTVRQIAIDERRGRVWLPLSDVGRIGRVEFRR